jgi:aminomethyltransferase
MGAGRIEVAGDPGGSLEQPIVVAAARNRGIARQGYAIYANGEQVGTVTSGTQTPFLKKAIGLGYVPTALALNGTELEIDIRGRRLRAQVVPTPFYKRTK